MIFMANGTTQLNQILYELFIDKSLVLNYKKSSLKNLPGNYLNEPHRPKRSWRCSSVQGL